MADNDEMMPAPEMPVRKSMGKSSNQDTDNEATPKPVVKVRTEFPETWIWQDDISRYINTHYPNVTAPQTLLTQLLSMGLAC